MNYRSILHRHIIVMFCLFTDMGTNLESEFLIRILKACYCNVLSVYRYGNEPGVRVSDTYSEGMLS